MKILAFEGIDNSGRTTHSKMMHQWLELMGFKTVYLNLDSEEIKGLSVLTSDGTAGEGYTEKSQEVLQSLSDAYFNALAHFEKDGVDYVVIDQYIAYLYAQSVSCGVTKENATAIISRLRKPDMEFYLRFTPADVSLRNKSGSMSLNDGNFRLLVLLSAAYKEYYDESELTTDHFLRGITDIANYPEEVIQDRIRADVADMFTLR